MIKLEANETTELDDKQTEAGVEKPLVTQVVANSGTDTKVPLQPTPSPTCSSKPPTLQRKDITKAYLGQNINKVRCKHERTESGTAQENIGTAPLSEGIITYTPTARAKFKELCPVLPQGTPQLGGKARINAEAGRIPTHDWVLAKGSAMIPKDKKPPP